MGRRALVVTEGAYAGPERRMVESGRLATQRLREQALSHFPHPSHPPRPVDLDEALAAEEAGGRRLAVLFMCLVALTLMWGTCELLVKQHSYQDGKGNGSVLQTALSVFRR